MSWLQNSWVVGLTCLVAGAVFGYWLWRWKERNIRAALAIKEQSILDSAQRQAENIAREVRIQANEEAIRIRQDTEKSLGSRLEQISETEKRLGERESLITRQFEHLVQEEKALREQQQECKKSFAMLEERHSELTRLMQQRREELERLSHTSEAD